MTSPANHTIIANLPTGTGKSLVGLFPFDQAVRNPQRGGCTVVVVPTITLAQDQDRKLRGNA